MTLGEAGFSPQVMGAELHPATDLKDVFAIARAVHEYDEFPMLWPYLGPDGAGQYDEGYRRLPDGRVITLMPNGWTTPY